MKLEDNKMQVICTVIISNECSDEQNIAESFDSLENQVLGENEYLQIMDFHKQFKNFTFLNPNICLSSYPEIKGKYICYMRMGNSYTSNYFTNIFQQIYDYESVIISGFYGPEGQQNMQNVFYENDRIIRIACDPEVAIDFCDSAWIPSSYIKSSIFDNGIDEVSFKRLLFYVILQNKEYRILGRSVIEAVIGGKQIKKWALPKYRELSEFYLRVINFSYVQNGKVETIVQYMLIRLYRNFLHNRSQLENCIVENGDLYEQYSELAQYVLSHISSQIVVDDKNLTLEEKIFLYRIGDKFFKGGIDTDGKLCITNSQGESITYIPLVEYLFATIKAYSLKVEGTVYMPFGLNKEFLICFKGKEKKYFATIKKNNQPIDLLGGIVNERYFFECAIDVTNDDIISCYISIDGQEYECSRYKYGRFFPVKANVLEQYYYHDGFVLVAEGAKLKIFSVTRNDIQNMEFNFQKNMRMDNLLIRKYAKCNEHKSKIWLIWDREDAAGDNGESLFRYMIQHCTAYEKIYFVIRKESPDYFRLKRTYHDNIIELGSLRHKKLFSRSDVLVGSQTDLSMWPLPQEEFRDIVSQIPFVFLQHGITKNDMSNNYSRYWQNIRLFVTAGVDEYKETLKIDNYGFDNSMVQLLGFPRFDYLRNESKKWIVILPTWRRYCIENGCEKKLLKDDFEKSEYYIFYNNFLHNDKLSMICKKYGYKVLFMQHAIMKLTDDLFDCDGVVQVANEEWTYNRVLSEASLLITDYSSVSFDFAYLKKPIIYCQFDKEKFYKTHTYKEGYFEYERDGFGPVTYDVSSAVKIIEKMVKDQCKMLPVYLKRVEKFFAYTDQNNCERVANAIRGVIEKYEK